MRPTLPFVLVCGTLLMAACTGGPATPTASPSPGVKPSRSPAGGATPTPGDSASTPGSASPSSAPVADPSAPATIAEGATVWIDDKMHVDANAQVKRNSYGSGGEVITITAGFLEGQYTNMSLNLQKEAGVLASGFTKGELTNFSIGLTGTINRLSYNGPGKVGLVLVSTTGDRLIGVAESSAVPERVGQGSGGPKVRMEFNVAMPTPRP